MADDAHPNTPEFLTSADLVALTGANLRTVQRDVARWRREGQKAQAEGRVLVGCPRVVKRTREGLGGREFVVEAESYFAAQKALRSP